MIVTNIERANKTIAQMEEKIYHPVPVDYRGKLYTGVDLGTANVVVTVLDGQKQPLAGAIQEARVVKDGLVVDFLGAVNIVRDLVKQVEERLNMTLTETAVAIPPGTGQGDTKAIVNVVRGAGLEVNNVVDEPTAAAAVLGITDGAVVDIGGGTTGISVLENGEVVYVADEPTGGTHFSLVLAGAYHLDFEQAELLKRDPDRHREVFPLVVPVIEKVAAIINKHIMDKRVRKIFLVGGTVCLAGLEKVVAGYTGIETIKPYNPMLVTPLGIAMHCK